MQRLKEEENEQQHKPLNVVHSVDDLIFVASVS